MSTEVYSNSEADSPCFSSFLEHYCPSPRYDEFDERPTDESEDPTIFRSNPESQTVVAEEDLSVVLRKSREAWSSRGLRFQNIDGLADDYILFPTERRSNSENPHPINSTDIDQRTTRFTQSMEVKTENTRPSAMVRPLYVRKPSSQAHNSQNSHQGSSEKASFPPRTSSIRSHDNFTANSPPARAKTPSVPLDRGNSPVASGFEGHYLTRTYLDTKSMSQDSVFSTDSSSPSRVHSDASIMGNFVPIDSPNMAGLEPDMEPSKVYLQSGPRRQAQAVNVINPYEFEAVSPHEDLSRQTNFTNLFRAGREVQSTYSPRTGHVKNATSEGNATHLAQASNQHPVSPHKSNSHGLYRSESSPNINQVPCTPFPSLRNQTPIRDVLQYYSEPREYHAQSHRGRAENASGGGQDFDGSQALRSPHRYHNDSVRDLRMRSPTRQSPRTSATNNHAINRSLARSPTRTLNDVNEGIERENGSRGADSPPPSSPPKKRSRSPMKKMFGEHGWLGTSADEKFNPNQQAKKVFVTHMDFSNRPKKLGMMEKLKNKFEDMAVKADMSPRGRSGRSRSNTTDSDQQRAAILSISLGPPEQARIYMELELMLVHTANCFLMNQFSQGRMDVDSIKKAVDVWKSKGRPVVIEFMYDQATQRDICLANQQNFRFHGEKAGSDIRINSMLYNWKQVGNHMAIRTFCNADTVILKLLFDIEQILELLGAGEPMMIRLQQIRTTSTEIMRVTRHNNHVKANYGQSHRSREPPRASGSSAGGGAPFDRSSDDPYGGMKLVPDSFVG